RLRGDAGDGAAGRDAGGQGGGRGLRGADAGGDLAGGGGGNDGDPAGVSLYWNERPRVAGAGADHLFCGVLSVGISAVLLDRGFTGRDDELGAGIAATEYVHGDAA